MKRLAAAAALFGMLWVVADLVATRTPFGAWVRSMIFGVTDGARRSHRIFPAVLSMANVTRSLPRNAVR